jgi:triosephosphate isomerase
VLAHEMTPVLCLGESLAIREEGEALAHCAVQLDAGLSGLPTDQV